MGTLSPQLTYACELEPGPLAELFANPQVIPFLQATQATVSLGILDLSDSRAETVKCLNAAGVPVTAWLLLPKDQGYWFNLDNYPQAVARYTQFKDWTAHHGLTWNAIGLDIEADLQAIQMLTAHRYTALAGMISKSINTGRLVNGTHAYQELVRQIHADGYLVEAYQYPFIIDERLAKSRFLQRLTGMVDLPEVDHEVLMLYSSFMRPWGQGVLWSYAPEARGIGIGSTGGGVDLPAANDIRPLNWAELQTDLLLAHRHSDRLFIFSLEGCVRQGLLPQLQAINWQQPVDAPYAYAERVYNLRLMLKRGLWLTTRPAWLLFGLAMMVSAVTLVTRRRK